MTEKNLDSTKNPGVLAEISQGASSMAHEAYEWMKEHPKTTAAIGAGLAGAALLLSKGGAAGLLKGGEVAESALPSATALGRGMENGQGTVLGMFDDLVKNGQYTFKDGVMMPTGKITSEIPSASSFAAGERLPSALLGADNGPGTVAGLLDKMVKDGSYKVVGDPKSPFFMMKPAG